MVSRLRHSSAWRHDHGKM